MQPSCVARVSARRNWKWKKPRASRSSAKRWKSGRRGKMTERRRIGLNLNMPDLAHRESQDSMRGQREAPSDQAREQFKQALSKGDAAEQPARLPADSPFALLGR